jgi:WD40 repeat protein
MSRWRAVVAVVLTSSGGWSPAADLTPEQVGGRFAEFAGQTVEFGGCRLAGGRRLGDELVLSVTSPKGVVYAGPPNRRTVTFVAASGEVAGLVARLDPAVTARVRLICRLEQATDGLLRAVVSRVSPDPVRLAGHTEPVMGLCYLSDGQTLVTAGGMDESVRLWRADTGAELAALPGVDLPVNAVAASADGRLVAAGGMQPPGRGQMRVGRLWVWAVADRKPVYSARPDPAHAVAAVALSPVGDRVVAGGRNKQSAVVGLPAGKVGPVLDHECPLKTAVYAPDGGTLATVATRGVVALTDLPADWQPPAADAGGELRLWDAAGKPLAVVPRPAEVAPYCAAFAPDGRRLAIGTAAGVELWEVAGPRLVCTVPAGSGVILAVAFSPDGRRLAAGGTGRRVQVWDVATGAEWVALTDQPGAVRGLGFSPDGRTLAVAAGKTPQLWDLAFEAARRAPPPAPVVVASAASPPAETAAPPPPPAPPAADAAPPARPRRLGPVWDTLQEFEDNNGLVVYAGTTLMAVATALLALRGKLRAGGKAAAERAG